VFEQLSKSTIHKHAGEDFGKLEVVFAHASLSISLENADLAYGNNRIFSYSAKRRDPLADPLRISLNFF